MRALRYVAMTTVFAAGFATVLLLWTPAALAWDWNHLPNGYAVTDVNLGGGCHRITISGHLVGSTCDSGFQAALDSYIDSTICSVNPVAGGAACQTTTAVTSTT